MGPIQSGINQIVQSVVHSGMARNIKGLRTEAKGIRDEQSKLNEKLENYAKDLKNTETPEERYEVQQSAPDVNSRALKKFMRNATDEQLDEFTKVAIATDASTASKLDDLEKQSAAIRSEALPSYKPVSIGNDMTKDIIAKKMKQVEEMEKIKETIKNPEQEIPLNIEPEVGNQMATEVIETKLNQNKEFEELKEKVEKSEDESYIDSLTKKSKYSNSSYDDYSDDFKDFIEREEFDSFKNKFPDLDKVNPKTLKDEIKKHEELYEKFKSPDISHEEMRKRWEDRDYSNKAIIKELVDYFKLDLKEIKDSEEFLKYVFTFKPGRFKHFESFLSKKDDILKELGPKKINSLLAAYLESTYRGPELNRLSENIFEAQTNERVYEAIINDLFEEDDK